MLKNWTNIFIYHIKNNKFFTALNVLGLSIGIAGLIFAILYWNEEHSYDQWNPEKDKIYSVMSNLGGGNIWAVTSTIPAPILKSTTSYLDEYCYFRNNYSKGTIQYRGKIELVDKIFTAQSSFFSFFPFEFIRGNAKNAIHDRNSIALSEETAARLFKDENPMGKQVRYAERLFVVRGVYRLSDKSSVQPSAVTTIIEDDLEKYRESWGLSYGLMLKLKKQTDTTAVIKQLDKIFLEKNYKKQAKKEGLSLEDFIKRYGEPLKAELLPLNRARLYQGNTPFPEGNANLTFLRILMALSILILLLSIANYINLATANAVKRAKEVGIRKVIGASKLQIVIQFVFETILITLFSVLLALVIVELSLPFYNALLNKNLILIGNQFYLQLVLVFILVVFVSGVIPAIYISNFEVLKVLKGNFSRSKSGVWLRNGMLILQFSIATFFIIGSFIVYQQVNFMTEKDLGFKGAQVIDISFMSKKGRGQFERYKAIQQELQKINGVEAVSTGSFSIGSSDNSWSGLHYKNHQEVITQQMGVDFGMLNLLKIQVIKGRDLTEKISSDTISNVLLNETAAKTLMEKDPINKIINWQDGNYKVVGIVKDFNYFGLENKISPMIFFHIKAQLWTQNEIRTIAVKISPNKISKTIGDIGKFWKTKVDTEYPFEYNFVDRNYARTYKKYQDQSQLFSLLNGIVILIAVFGLFALASFSMERRFREIAIRKTLGAETNILLKELSKQYVFFCLIGFAIGIVPAYLLLQKWLENFAFRIDIPVLPFFVALIALMFLTLTIVLAKAYQVTKIDVLKYLKYE
ncbi:putative ABC transport system permease protein [Flavobacterium sp. 90]|uniref:ABC transporter permease n=1 Tax=unclassified Flavobacterium TaxID=196869 RepID=UPI000EB224B8|nr:MULTISPECIES: ABC transporter permease [unclassified Flavobacterium]RKR10757.1 putative ABC transport system permease protein [Flavobacterium sp. 81]TCK54540.1 putative ABC transport system permease protein [Flavobacterium sp. 90]